MNIIPWTWKSHAFKIGHRFIGGSNSGKIYFLDVGWIIGNNPWVKWKIL